MAIPCRLHGGPLDGRVLHLDQRVTRLTVPVATERACLSTDDTNLASLLEPPVIEWFRYVVSLERWPIPADGPTFIGYPEL